MIEFSYFLIDDKHYDLDLVSNWIIRKLREAEKNPKTTKDDLCYIILSKITERAIATICCTLLIKYPHYLYKRDAIEKISGHWISDLIIFSKISLLFTKNNEKFRRKIPEIKQVLHNIIKKYDLVCIPKIISAILKECHNSS